MCEDLLNDVLFNDERDEAEEEYEAYRQAADEANAAWNAGEDGEY